MMAPFSLVLRSPFTFFVPRWALVPGKWGCLYRKDVSYYGGAGEVSEGYFLPFLLLFFFLFFSYFFPFSF